MPMICPTEIKHSECWKRQQNHQKAQAICLKNPLDRFFPTKRWMPVELCEDQRGDSPSKRYTFNEQVLKNMMIAWGH